MTETKPDDIRFCVIIPIYNHHRTITAMVDAVRLHDLPCLIVDDGSNEETRQVLGSLADREGVTVYHQPTNQGKGAACRHGLKRAAELGFSHALQIDADGQHDAADIPRFLAAARAFPKAMVIGKPRYDESVPMGRFIGRYLTHVWVWIETLSLAIKDTMCGFRVYPLAATMRIIDSPLIGNRMSFDTSILVRLYWQGVYVINLETRVKYHQDGVSHFRPIKDNLCISWMHTCLVAGMLCRLPILLFRRSRELEYPPEDWLCVGERGSILGMRFTLLLYRILGYRLCALFMEILIVYFWLTGRQTRHYSELYFKHLSATPEGQAALGHSPDWHDTYRHFRQYGYAILDKFAAWMNDLGRHHLVWENHQELRDIVESGQGIVLMGAHLGNVEVIRAMSETLKVARVNALMIVSNAAKFNRLLREIDHRVDVRLIATDKVGADTAILLRERLDQGELVALMGDRYTQGSRERLFHIPFLGKTAPIPQGPFVLASLLDSPVYTIFVTRLGFRRYHVHLERFADTLAFPRKDRFQKLEGAAQRFVKKMEEQCYRTPYQWFNFYDYWQ